MIKGLVLCLCALMLTANAVETYPQTITPRVIKDRRTSSTLRQTVDTFVVGRFTQNRGTRGVNGWYAMRQDFIINSNSPATQTNIYLRLRGLSKDTAYDIETGKDNVGTGLNTGFNLEKCTPSAAWTTVSTNEITTDDKTRTSYNLIIDTVLKLINDDPNNLV